MANSPTFGQYRVNSSYLYNGNTQLQIWGPETLEERMLTCLCVFVSRQNPDGTAYGT